MTYISVPNTFTSAVTFFASAMTSNFTALIDGLSDGTKSLDLNSIKANTFLVSSPISCPSNVNVTSGITIANAVAATTVITSISANVLSLGAPETVSVISNVLLPTQTNTKVESSTNLEQIDTTNFNDGDFLLLCKGSSSFNIIKGNNIVLGAASRTFSTTTARMLLVLQNGNFYELQFQG